MKFLLKALAWFLLAQQHRVADAKIRGGPSAALADFEGLLASFNHDDLLAAYKESKTLLRDSGGAEANPEIHLLSKQLLHRAKNLHLLESGMPVEEFEELNDKMHQLDVLVARLDTADENEGQGSRRQRRTADDEMIAEREKSKTLGLEIKALRKRYSVSDPKTSGLTGAEEERVRELRLQLKDGVDDPLQAKELRDELDLLYLKHQPKKRLTNKEKRERTNAGRVSNQRRRKKSTTWAELSEDHLNKVAELREKVSKSQDRDEIAALRAEIEQFRDGTHPDLAPKVTEE